MSGNKLFDKRFVRFLWEDELEDKDKNLFVADNIPTLITRVEMGISNGFVRKSRNADFPFFTGTNNSRFCYYDPHYDVKRAYYVERKKLQYYDSADEDWEDVQGEPSWRMSPDDYRIKPEKKAEERVTHKEMAEWLAKGKGQYMSTHTPMYLHSFAYRDEQDNERVPEDIRVRAWGDSKWHEPTKEYLGVIEVL